MFKQSQTARPVRMAAVAVIAGFMAMLAACSSTTTSNGSTGTPAPHTHSGSPTANQAVCTHVNSIRGSLESLTHVQLSASSAGKIRSDLTSIQTQLAMLKVHGSSALSSSVDQLSGSLKQVEKAARGLSSPPSASQITAIVTALSTLKSQSAATVTAMRAACP